MLGLLKKIFGSKKEKDIAEIKPYIDKINQEYAQLSGLSHDAFRARTQDLRKKIADFVHPEEAKIEEIRNKANVTTDMDEKERLLEEADKMVKLVDEKLEIILLEILPQAFAIVKETGRRFKENPEIAVTATPFDRELSVSNKVVSIDGDKAIWKNTWDAAGTTITWDMVHYDVQLLGGVVLHQGKISEMMTGEGKTLVATLPIFLNALTGKGVHVVTVNDYLAKRDSEWNAPIFMFHGLAVDCIDKHEPNSDRRRKAYRADIVYGTNNEFGFDYLRDNMANSVDHLVQQKLHFAIVDEVDSVLIDDARTPLIISGPTPQGDKHEFYELKPKIERLVAEQRKYINLCLTDAKKLLSGLGEDGRGNVDKDSLEKGGMAVLRAHRGLPRNKALIKFMSEPGVKAIMQKTESQYMAEQQKEMHKVDKELFFVIDERNNQIELTEKGIELLSSGEDSSYYIMPDVGAEIAKIQASGLATQEQTQLRDTLMRDYTIKAERIHTMNQLLRAYAMFERDVEYVIMDGKVKIVDEQTGRIMEGRRYSDGLHQAIEAKENVKVEAATQTYATITLQNYFRMYHKLAGMTGTAETEAKELWDIYKLDVVTIPTHRAIVRKDENDLVYKTAREKYNAVIDEIASLREAGRPVLVGTTSVEISELLSRMLKLRNIPHQVLNAKLHQKEADIVAFAGQSGTVTIATNMAGRGTDIKLGPGVKEAGGLAIIGTERHESRRVDRQLRGRSGRQGDPGSSQFFVSLEDNLMRLFGSERIARMMDRLGMKEGEVIQHGMITKSIERAQKKVEENNFGIRKRLLEYDDVMNVQRKTIYSKRRNALYGDRMDIDLSNMFYDVAESLVAEYQDVRDYDTFRFECLRNLAIDAPVSEDEFLSGDTSEIAGKLFDLAMKTYRRNMDGMLERIYGVVKNVYETQSSQYENIVVPFTDGIRTLQSVVNLKESYESGGRAALRTAEKSVLLAVLDNEWKEHLREMDDLKQSVQQAVYEQKDPLVVYKLESYELFKKLIDKMNKEVISFLVKAQLPVNTGEQQVQKAPAPRQELPKNVQTSRTEIPSYGDPSSSGDQQQRVKTQPVRVEKKVGRNDACPCGSGKKYKNCHGIGE
ncbi:MAG TPA: preprotein translocase subunit SecA [Flavobacteriales bacterium]|nr:preprotein translocase subunit SecA [Flavobacteriales bacterium]HRE74782.1 preprotein translocase subunit SecA [Flavobacteriales bacterium]HRJ35991.1 preprotein translocase subunit SecA [Flavobacteriales bacterium]HRJ38391.1 preprotein translocase subunit SecA [Flavobacteriales bacterium]